MTRRITDNTVFGFCRGCKKWKIKDDMVASTIKIFGKGVDNVASIIRLRLCPACYERESRGWRQLAWDYHILTAAKIRVDEKAALRCDDVDFDDSQSAVMAARDAERNSQS